MIPWVFEKGPSNFNVNKVLNKKGTTADKQIPFVVLSLYNYALDNRANIA
jgi:hypothetical protein